MCADKALVTILQDAISVCILLDIEAWIHTYIQSGWDVYSVADLKWERNRPSC